MKKRTISAIILMALIIATFSIFAMPASADVDVGIEATTITPGDIISVTEKYSEFIINLPNMSAYDFPFLIPSGYHIIQTFGGNVSTKFSILEYTGNVLGSNTLVSINDTNGNGYQNNSFIHYDFSADAYTLRVQGATKIRLSITRAENFATEYGTLPMTCYEDIIAANTLTTRFYNESSAIVFRYIPDATRTRDIELSGASTVRVCVMDPSSKTGFDEIVVTGEGTYTTPTLYNGKPYYIVMYVVEGIEDGDNSSNELGYIEATVSIG